MAQLCRLGQRGQQPGARPVLAPPRAAVARALAKLRFQAIQGLGQQALAPAQGNAAARQFQHRFARFGLGPQRRHRLRQQHQLQRRRRRRDTADCAAVLGGQAPHRQGGPAKHLARGRGQALGQALRQQRGGGRGLGPGQHGAPLSRQAQRPNAGHGGRRSAGSACGGAGRRAGFANGGRAQAGEQPAARAIPVRRAGRQHGGRTRLRRGRGQSGQHGVAAAAVAHRHNPARAFRARLARSNARRIRMCGAGRARVRGGRNQREGIRNPRQRPALRRVRFHRQRRQRALQPALIHAPAAARPRAAARESPHPSFSLRRCRAIKNPSRRNDRLRGL